MIYKEHYVADFMAKTFGPEFKPYACLTARRDYPNPSIGLFDDEFETEPLSKVQIGWLKNCAIITRNKQRYNELKNNGINVAYYPWCNWIQVLCPIVYWNKPIPDRPQNEIMWNFLNRRWAPGRHHALEYLTHDLKMSKENAIINKGHVTANYFPYFENHPALKRDQEFLNKYDNLPAELNLYEDAGIHYSPNVVNVWDIVAKVPGKICIQIESFWEPDHSYNCFATEKSLTPFLTKNIPILIQAKTGFMRELREQGFDLFDDIIDHRYDSEPNYYKRIELAFELNRHILTSDPTKLDIEDRLLANQNLVLGAWYNQQLKDLRYIVDNLKNNL